MTAETWYEALGVKHGDRVKVSGRHGTLVNIDSEGATVRYPDLSETWATASRIVKLSTPSGGWPGA